MSGLSPEFKEQMRQLALSGGADHAAWIDPADIPLLAELQDICRQNSCGQYGKSWMGPPAIGTVAELMPVVRSCSAGLVVQTVGQLEDSYDYPGMVEAKSSHQAVFAAIADSIREAVPALPGWSILPLSAGCCQICGDCTYPGEPCLQPEKAMAAVEAYGIYVNAMLVACGLAYNNGPNTISYVGLVLFRETPA